ncbi:penicillin-binding protein 2 [Psychrosphaera sp. F3M07]|uniref:penicillin-binding protein 2 n=1 Tax=Psychrosphaera sp. F3M07 TaxID=2841560 RepID=UPI001C09DDAF|nr:penicillin-binding protein 2 [Psychrosphaera sp. F3M07]MBU2917371.1 penicillin-binding protein 2 [Psychrosphaera sp. F3M07]
MRRNSYHIQDHSAESNLFARRAIISLIGVGSLLLLIIANLFYLQISSYKTYQTRSNDNRIKVQPIPPNRGVIKDINGKLLAGNEPTFSLDLVPEQITDMDETLTEIGKIIEISDEQIKVFKRAIKYRRRFKGMPLKSKLSDKEVAMFSVHQHRFPGVSIEARLARHYPFGEYFTHGVGYVGKINKKDLQRLEDTDQIKNYAATRSIGKLGIERYYENQLHGITGSQEVEVNHRSRILRQLSVTPPVSGTDLHLSIDVELQIKAKEILGENKGAIIAMDPRDGALLTFYSNPTYDPNLFVNGISQVEYSKIIGSKDKPMLNRVTQGQYPPASTIKPQLALLALDKGLITKHTTIRDPGYWHIPNVEGQRRFRDWKPGGHGHVDVLLSIKQSCDIFYYDLAYRLGIDNISEFGSKFGFGDYTGVDIFEESKAIMPSREWKKSRFKQPWYKGDTISIGIGQGYWTATPVQLAMSTAALVNRGKVVEPRLVTGMTKNGVYQETPTRHRAPIDIKDKKHWDTVLDAMYETVNASDGTARTAFVDAVYSSAGKTGTAQLFSLAEDEEYEVENVAERYRDNAMYVGFAPFEAPSIVIVVAVENAGGGSANAAPIARKMLDLYFGLGLSGKRNLTTTAPTVDVNDG